MAQKDWSAAVTHRIGRELRRCRDERGLSAQKVANACGAIGVEIDRNVLAGLENRRRSIVSVAEIMALARVLGVAPLALIFPVGRDERLEALPGIAADPFTVAQWFSGEAPFPGDGHPDLASQPDPLTLYRQHSHTADELLQQVRTARRLLNDPNATGAEIKASQAAVRGHADALRTLRSTMRQYRVHVPPLPDAIGSTLEIDS
jgi:transcriptional regulator with XRE-family HTH domain